MKGSAAFLSVFAAATLLLAAPGLPARTAAAADTAAVAPAPDGGGDAATPRVERKEIEKEINCVCEDNCGKLLANCICGFSTTMREEIDRLIAAGLTRTEVFEALVKRFGARVIASPPTTGWLGRLAWIAPFAALLLGAWILVRVVRRLVARPRERPAEPPPEPSEGVASSVHERKFEEELSRFES